MFAAKALSVSTKDNQSHSNPSPDLSLLDSWWSLDPTYLFTFHFILSFSNVTYILKSCAIFIPFFPLSWFFSRWYWYYWYCRKSKTEDLLILSKCPQNVYGLGKQEIQNPMYSTCMCQIYSTMITKNLVVVKCAMTPFKGQCFIISSAFRTNMLKSQWN